jgi:TRAP-type C4-dicarboxylate transport system permease small subunit
MKKLEYLIRTTADRFNLISAAAVIMIMLIIVLDITMRIFRISLPGAYDIVSLLGTVVIAFSLTYTTIQQGHIAVDLVYQKLPEKIHPYIDFFNDSAGCLFFAVLSWQSFLHAGSLKAAGEVSLTIKIPGYPFVAGIGLSCLLLSVYLFLGVIKSAKRAAKL